MYKVGLKEAELRLLELTNEVSKGEEVVIMREDGALFKIVDITDNKPNPKFGSAKRAY